MKKKLVTVTFLFALFISLFTGCQYPAEISSGTESAPLSVRCLQEPSPRPIPVPVVVGSIYNGVGSGALVMIQISIKDAPVTDACVRVNGIQCPHSSSGNYIGELDTVPAGIVKLSITGKHLHMKKKLIMPAPAIIISPVNAGGPFAAAEDTAVICDAAAAMSDYLTVEIDGTYTVSGKSFHANEENSNTALIPGGTLKPGLDNVVIKVLTANGVIITDDNDEIIFLFALVNTATSESFAVS